MSAEIGTIDLSGLAWGPAVVRSIGLRDATVAYGRMDALHRCTVDFASGEVAALLGPNGAGKSTALRLLATLEAPAEGRVVFDETRDALRERDFLRRQLGLVAHESLLYHELSGRENLEFHATLHGLPARSAAEEWLARVGLRDAADRRVGAYSRGMRQRLSIARALLHAPSVVLFDEVLTGLDRGAQRTVRTLAAWLRAQGRVVVMVTHQLDAPDAEFDRVIVLDRGRIRRDVRSGAALARIWEEAIEGGRRTA